MTTEQEQPKEKRRRTSGTQRASGSQAQQPEPQPATQAEQDQPPAQGQGQQAATGQDLGQLLQQQIAQAIQPVMDDFRQQLAQTVYQQVEADSALDVNGRGVQQEAPQAPAPGLQDGHQPVEEKPSQPRPERQPAQQADQPGGQAPEPQAFQGLVKGTLRPAFRLAEEQGEQWLQSLLVAGLTALLAESTRQSVQQHSEQRLHALLQKSFQSLPDSPTSRELQAQTERTLQAILREMLDAMFAEAMRASMQQHGELAIRESLHGDFGTALRNVEEALGAMVQELVAVLRRQWQRVLRLLLKVILTALQSSLAASEKESLTEASTA